LEVEAKHYRLDGLIKLLENFHHPCNFSTLGDTNGIFHWIGTKEGKTGYINPVDLGLVSIVSSNGVGGAKGLVGREGADCGNCNSFQNQYLTIEVKGYILKVNRYSARHVSSCCVPSNWQLSGSMDGKTFATLMTHTNDTSLTRLGQQTWVTQEMDCTFLRLTCTGYDQSGGGCFCFHLSSLEFYGDVRRIREK